KGASLINHEDQVWENAPGGTFDGKVSVIKADTSVMSGAAVHEFGHLYDATGKKETGQDWDDNSLFTAGLVQDKQGLTAFDDLKGHNRKEEIFAESFAHSFVPQYRSREFPDWDQTHPGITKFFDSMMDQSSLQQAPGVDAQKLFEAPAPATRGAAG